MNPLRCILRVAGANLLDLFASPRYHSSSTYIAIAAIMPANSSRATKRFELPQLTPVNYSLTEGTNIPPPPESPVREEPPPLPVAPKEQLQNNDPPTPTASTNGEAYEARGRTQHPSNSIPPLSPASTTNTRPGSIRRFLSRRSLHSGYANGNKSVDDLSNYGGNSTVVEAGGRPGSSLDKHPRPKRSSSWFRRLGSSSYGESNGAGNRTSIVYEEAPQKKGPPPPTLPELKIGGRSVKEDDGGLGGADMFRNIR